VQAQQVRNLLVVGRQDLRKGGGDREAREHLEEVVVRAVEAEWEAAKARGVCAGVCWEGVREGLEYVRKGIWEGMY